MNFAAHTIQSEFHFIETMGDYSGKTPRQALLRGYLKGLDLRVLDFAGGVMSETTKSILREHARIFLRGCE